MIETRKKYALMQDIGVNMVITSIAELEPSKVAMLEDNAVHPISEIAAWTVNTANGNNKPLAVKKEALIRETIEIDDLFEAFIVDEDPLLNEKRAVMVKVYAALFAAVDTEAQLGMLAFQILNTRFASMGLFITPENKQEIYIKIIEMDDDNLLEDLEKYLDAKAKIDEAYNMFKRTQIIKTELQYSETKESIEELYSNFIRNK